MTTTIDPGSGHGLLFSQQGTGTSPGYDAVDLRRCTNLGLQEGVIEGDAYLVTERGAGANMSVDISNDGFALVKGDTITGQGLYVIPPHSATINETIDTADDTNPRIDQIILEIRDNTHDAEGGNEARVRVLKGTATAGADLDDRLGAASLPDSAIRLADVLVAASASSIEDSDIRDRRPWARGVNLVRTITGGDYTLANDTSSPGTSIDSTNLKARVECSGAPLIVELHGSMSDSAQLNVQFELLEDGSVKYEQYATIASTGRGTVAVRFAFTPTAGSHTYEIVQYNGGSATAKLLAGTGNPLTFRIREDPAQNAANNATTTG